MICGLSKSIFSRSSTPPQVDLFDYAPILLALVFDNYRHIRNTVQSEGVKLLATYPWLSCHQHQICKTGRKILLDELMDDVLANPMLSRGHANNSLTSNSKKRHHYPSRPKLIQGAPLDTGGGDPPIEHNASVLNISSTKGLSSLPSVDPQKRLDRRARRCRRSLPSQRTSSCRPQEGPTAPVCVNNPEAGTMTASPPNKPFYPAPGLARFGRLVLRR